MPRFFFDRLLHLGFAFVVQFLALCDADLKFYPAVFPVDARDDQRHPFLVVSFSSFSISRRCSSSFRGPQGVVILMIAVRISAKYGHSAATPRPL